MSWKWGGRGKQEMGAEGEQSKMRGSMGYNSLTCECYEVVMSCRPSNLFKFLSEKAPFM